MGAKSITRELGKEAHLNITPDRISRAVYRLGKKSVEVCALPRDGGTTEHNKPNAHGIWLGDVADPEKPAEGIKEAFKHSVELEIDQEEGAAERFFVFPYRDTSDNTIKLGTKPLGKI